MIKLQVGKRYVRRNGEITPVILNNQLYPKHSGQLPFIEAGENFCYMENGRVFTDCLSEFDAMFEYSNETSSFKVDLERPIYYRGTNMQVYLVGFTRAGEVVIEDKYGVLKRFREPEKNLENKPIHKNDVVWEVL